MITDDLIIQCAKENGFYVPEYYKIPFTNNKIKLSYSDIKVWRAITADFAGSRDLGEWWVSYTGSPTQFRVTDEEMKKFIRDRRIKEILNDSYKKC